MAARGAIIRGYPRDNSVKLKIPRNDILESPLLANSPVKPNVQARLESLAVEIGTEITVMDGESGTDAGKLLARYGPDIRAREDGVTSRHTKTASGQSGSSGSSIPRSSNGTSGQSTTTTVSVSKDEKGEKVSDDVENMAYGLEMERMCEIIINGEMENVQIAKVRILILLDELVSHLFFQYCD